MSDNITRILVPIDFSTNAERATAYATTLAHRLGASVAFLHVVEDPFVTGAWSGEAYLPNAGELLETEIAGAERRLAPAKTAAEALGLAADSKVVTGRPAHAIVEYARSGGFDLIVMATHGRTGVSHAVMGSIAERVVRTAPCPVLTVRIAQSAAVAAA